MTGSRSQKFNELIVRLALRYKSRGPVLVLTPRVAHAEILGRMLKGYDPVVLTGKSKPRERQTAFKRIRQGALITIATFNLFGEGIDVPGWSVLIMGGPVAGGPRTLQAIGRIMRPSPSKKKPLVIDLVDEHDFCKAAAFLREKVIDNNIRSVLCL